METKTSNEDTPEDPGFTVTDRRVSTREDDAAAPSDAPAEAPEQAAEETESATPESSAFARLAVSLHMNALYHLGTIPGPDGEKPPRNLALARESIDILEMLRDKTKGNLDPGEDKLMMELLGSLHLTYLRAAAGEGG